MDDQSQVRGASHFTVVAKAGESVRQSRPGETQSQTCEATLAKVEETVTPEYVSPTDPVTLDEKGIALLKDPRRNSREMVRNEVLRFLDRYVPAGLEHYHVEITSLAQRHLGTEEIAAVPGFYVRSFAWPPILAMLHGLLYWSGLRRVDPPPGKIRRKRYLMNWLRACRAPRPGCFLLSQDRDFDTCSQVPKFLSARLELGSKTWKARKVDHWCSSHSHAAWLIFNSTEALYFGSDPELCDPHQGLELVVGYEGNLEVRLPWCGKHPIVIQRERSTHRVLSIPDSRRRCRIARSR